MGHNDMTDTAGTKRAKKRTGTRPRPMAGKPEAIKPLADGLSRYGRWMIYGDPGVGKTPLAATAPNALILDADHGLESAVMEGAGGETWQIDDYNDATEAMEYLRHGGHKSYEFIVLDSGTIFQERGMDHIMADLVAAKPHRVEWLPDKGEFYQNQQRTSKFIKDLVSLPVNVIVTAHTMMGDRELADGSVTTWMMPSFQGRGIGLSIKICTYMSIVAHLHTVPSKKKPGNEYPVLSTRRKDGWYAKDRYGVIGTMARPTIPKIVQAIEAKRASLRHTDKP